MFYLKKVILIICAITSFFIIFCVLLHLYGLVSYYCGNVIYLQSFTPEEMLNRINEVQSNYNFWHEQEVQADNDFKNSLRGTDKDVQQECLNAKKECERNARQESRMLNILQHNYNNNIFSDNTDSVLGKRRRD